MPTFRLDKLVRTKLLQMFKELDQQAEVTELSGGVLEKALVAKLVEEIGELQATKQLDVKELADLLQIIHDAAFVAGSSPEQLEALRVQRAQDRGGLIEERDGGEFVGYHVGTLSCRDGDSWIDYYRKEPERFPEIGEK